MNVTLCERVWVNYAKESYDYRLGLRNGTKEGHLNGMAQYIWAPHLVCCTNVYLSFSPISLSPFLHLFMYCQFFFLCICLSSTLLYLCILPYFSVFISVLSLCVYFFLFFYISLVCVSFSIFFFYVHLYLFFYITLLCLSVSLSLSMNPFLCLTISLLFVFIFLSFYLFLFLNKCVSVSLFLNFSISSFLCFLFICLYILSHSKFKSDSMCNIILFTLLIKQTSLIRRSTVGNPFPLARVPW